MESPEAGLPAISRREPPPRARVTPGRILVFGIGPGPGSRPMVADGLQAAARGVGGLLDHPEVGDRVIITPVEMTRAIRGPSRASGLVTRSLQIPGVRVAIS